MLDSVLRLGDVSSKTRRVLATLGLLIVYRFGFAVTIPGMSPEFLTAQKDQGSLFGLLSVFSGGAVGQTTNFALALLPWITVSIAEGLVLRLSPRVRALYTGSAEGRRHVARWTRGAVLPIALLLGLAIELGVFALCTATLLLSVILGHHLEPRSRWGSARSTPVRCERRPLRERRQSVPSPPPRARCWVRAPSA